MSENHQRDGSMNPNYQARAKRMDRFARWGITLGGLAVIFCVVFILVLIVNVALPLFFSAQVERQPSVAVESQLSGNLLAVGMDEYLETSYALSENGELPFYKISDGALLDQEQLHAPSGPDRLRGVEGDGRLRHVLLWEDGSVSVERVRFRPFFDAEQGNERSILHQRERLATFAPPASGVPERSWARISADGRSTRVDLFADGHVELLQRLEEENFLGETSFSEEEHEIDLSSILGRVASLVLSHDGQQLFIGSSLGELMRWDLADIEEPILLESRKAFVDQRAITALTMIFGDVSLAVGDATGLVTTWMPVRNEHGTRVLRRIHDLSRHDAPILALYPTQRDKNVISASRAAVHIDNMTSERHLLTLPAFQENAPLALTTRGNGLVTVSSQGKMLSWSLMIPHPEVSLKTLFGKVWYEGYDAPGYVWQSSAATDDYEAKLSLVPLIYGSLKGTFYAMFFAVPLAIFGAIYTSQFARPRLRGVIKPTVEIMAAVPTVIIGFLAALWLAPLIERSLGSLFLSLIFLPTTLVMALLVWQAARRNESLQRIERGFEFVAVAPILIGAVALAAWCGPLIEEVFFAGNLKQWLFNEMGVRYDPRNCIIIAFAMGFAVIPIIFTIAEDALSNVPQSLKAASLALGASRWQTVWRVMLPSASPGIFAGTMIGFGRAVGETMIVLMATGNTPIMDLSIFNGMRPLSANIAVEIPEAPVDGSLYRVLFLSAVLLFVMTFIVNTVAELIRQRLRAKYGRF